MCDACVSGAPNRARRQLYIWVEALDSDASGFELTNLLAWDIAPARLDERLIPWPHSRLLLNRCWPRIGRVAASKVRRISDSRFRCDHFAASHVLGRAIPVFPTGLAYRRPYEWLYSYNSYTLSDSSRGLGRYTYLMGRNGECTCPSWVLSPYSPA